jgi:hypothetical protein
MAIIHRQLGSMSPSHLLGSDPRPTPALDAAFVYYGGGVGECRRSGDPPASVKPSGPQAPLEVIERDSVAPIARTSRDVRDWQVSYFCRGSSALVVTALDVARDSV